MNPGRELDALIAENIMGWKFLTNFFIDNGPKRSWLGTPLKKSLIEREPIPHYSTDIAAAFEVIKRMDKLGHTFSCESYFTGNSKIYDKWQATFGERINNINGVAGVSVPHVICLAALEVVK